MDGLFRALQALWDPKAPGALRRRGLRLYALGLLGVQGLFLLLLAPFLPQAPHPVLGAFALLGGGWLFWLGRKAFQEAPPVASLVAVGLGVAAFFFLGVMGLLLRPWGLALWLVGLWAFGHLLRRGEAGLEGGEGGPGGGNGPGPGSP
ncbi:hypothetical protein GCM10007092_00700 [Thermus composti]|uniref:Uncharacterized protein n=1 Tax=Thermus composti TaxID=532059 RepID=A0ABV6PZM5_9DEIN|nr:hypothetical protein [Thermus composti]GGM91662.1 hypothetical protein GCM10007092_00700 [Thermus composti]